VNTPKTPKRTEDIKNIMNTPKTPKSIKKGTVASVKKQSVEAKLTPKQSTEIKTPKKSGGIKKESESAKKTSIQAEQTPKQPVQIESNNSGKKRKAEAPVEEQKAKKVKAEYVAFVNNICKATSQEKLLESFSDFGKVLDIDIINGKRRYAFVSFSDDASLQKAIAQNRKLQVDKKKLYITKRIDNNGHRIKLSGYKNKLDSDAVSKYFSKFGEVLKIRFFKFGCVVTISSEEAFNKALAKSDCKIGGEKVKLEKDEYTPNRPNKSKDKKKKQIQPKEVEKTEDEEMSDDEVNGMDSDEGEDDIEGEDDEDMEDEDDDVEGEDDDDVEDEDDDDVEDEDDDIEDEDGEEEEDDESEEENSLIDAEAVEED